MQRNPKRDGCSFIVLSGHMSGKAVLKVVWIQAVQELQVACSYVFFPKAVGLFVDRKDIVCMAFLVRADDN
jgi:hypothetical protein